MSWLDEAEKEYRESLLKQNKEFINTLNKLEDMETTKGMLYSPTMIARQFLFVREAAIQNTGSRVEGIQRWGNGSKGQSWCAYFATMILDIAFQGNSPIPRQGACQTIYDLAKTNKWITINPKVNDIFLYIDDNNHAHHIGIVTVDGGNIGIAGNTSADGASSNGDRVAEHELISNKKHIVYISYPR